MRSAMGTPEDSSLWIATRNSPVGQVVARVSVESYDQHPRMMTTGGHDQDMQVFEILIVSG